MIKVSKVEPLENYLLKLEFNNNEIKIFDMKEYLEHGVFKELVNMEIFRSVKINYDSIEWVNGADLCPDLLFEKSKILIS
ncbi:MAG: DUF2442 domain-containing protein [Candidatus Kapabacteria bacterium]|nr:DUF2442 domain-containing protein [Candidatus Kapabacteria bacterium]